MLESQDNAGNIISTRFSKPVSEWELYTYIGILQDVDVYDDVDGGIYQM